jgi:hypothetical protein
MHAKDGFADVNDRFAAKLRDPVIVKDTTTLADFVQIYCDRHHKTAERRRVETDGAQLGVYGRQTPLLCSECEAHLAYAEKRRAYCNQDPKPFCAYCEVHCYKSTEREWQRQMMRYAGLQSWRKGHAIDGIKHVLDGRKYRKLAEAKVKSATAEQTAAPAADNQEESR